MKQYVDADICCMKHTVPSLVTAKCLMFDVQLLTGALCTDGERESCSQLDYDPAQLSPAHWHPLSFSTDLTWPGPSLLTFPPSHWSVASHPCPLIG